MGQRNSAVLGFLGLDLVSPAFHLCTLKITFFAFWISETSCLMGCERIALEEWWVLYLVQVWRVSIPTRRHELLSLHQKYPFSSDIASSGRENVEDWFPSWWQFAHMRKQCERCAGTWIGSPKSFFSQVVCSGEGGRQCLAGTENFGEKRIWKTGGHRRKEEPWSRVMLEGVADDAWERGSCCRERICWRMAWMIFNLFSSSSSIDTNLKAPSSLTIRVLWQVSTENTFYSSFMINPVPLTKIKANFPPFPHLKKDWSETLHEFISLFNASHS